MITLTNLLEVNSRGLRTAKNNEILTALSNRYKEIFGTDIDLSSGTADGVFVYEMTDLIANLISTISKMYKNIDINQAEGVFLDELCALNNIFRKTATKSSVSLSVTNVSSSSQTFASLQFIDVNNNIWEYDDSITFTAGQTKTITALCSTAGAISAPANTITKTVDISYLTVSQPNAATIGTDAETDTQLRSRRASEISASGKGTIDAMIGSLLEVAGVQDVKIIENNTSASITASDGTTVYPHSIYIITRIKSGTDVPDSAIGDVIYKKGVPGIITTTPSASITTGTVKSYQYDTTTTALVLADTYVHWKQSGALSGATKSTVVKITKTGTTISSKTIFKLGSLLLDYFNSLPIGEMGSLPDIIMLSPQAEQTKGVTTFQATGLTSPTLATTDKLNHFAYTTWTQAQDPNDVNSRLITFS